MGKGLTSKIERKIFNVNEKREREKKGAGRLITFDLSTTDGVKSRRKKKLRSCRDWCWLSSSSRKSSLLAARASDPLPRALHRLTNDETQMTNVRHSLSAPGLPTHLSLGAIPDDLSGRQLFRVTVATTGWGNVNSFFAKFGVEKLSETGLNQAAGKENAGRRRNGLRKV